MNNVLNCLEEFFGQFFDPLTGERVPVFPEGTAARRFPYITFPVIRPSFANSVFASVSVWDRRPSQAGFKGVVEDILEQIAEKIPESGALLNLPGGAVWLLRAGEFQTYIPEPNDQYITRGVVNFSIRGYLL